MEHLATECGRDFAGSFTQNPHSLDIAYKLLLCGAHKIQDRLDKHCSAMQQEDSRNSKFESNYRIDVAKIFSFVQYEIFERLSYWMDMSMNRVAVWIKRAAEKEDWRPPSERQNAKKQLLTTFKVKRGDKKVFVRLALRVTVRERMRVKFDFFWNFEFL